MMHDSFSSSMLHHFLKSLGGNVSEEESGGKHLPNIV